MEMALTVALVVAALVWLSFSIWYMVRARWWKTAFGWNTLGVSLALTVILTRLAVLVAYPEVRGDLRVTGLGLYIALALLGSHRLYLLERAQRKQS